MAYLNLDNTQLELGQVRTVTKDSGKTIESVELLLGDQTKAEMKIDNELDVVNVTIKDTDLADVPDLNCAMNKTTLRDFIIGLKNLYNMLEDK